MTTEEWLQFKVDRQRDVTGDVVHPTLCPKLTLNGVDFAIPPRKVRDDACLAPVFSEDGKVELDIKQPPVVLEWPEIATVFAGAPVRVTVECDQGHIHEAEIEDMAEHLEYFISCCELAGRALREQYSLSADDLTLMLAPGDGNALWIAQLIDWCA